MPTVVIRHDLDLAPAIEDRRGDLHVTPAPDADAVMDLLPDADMLVVNPSNWQDEFLTALDPGDWIQATSAGYEAFPLEAFDEQGIVFTNATGNYGPVVAEHVFGLAFAFSRNLPEFRDRQREHRWERSEIALELSDWKDHRLTIFGLGNIGEAIAIRGQAFEMTVAGVKKTPADYDGCVPADRVVGPDRMETLLPKTDLLVVTAPLTEQTHHAIDQSVFTALPNDAIVINVARGPVVDTDALLDALEADEIAGAGLDVFEEEPLPEESPLWDRDDVLLTPHVGGRSDTFPDRFAELFLDNFDRRQRGDTLKNRIV
ncbi:MAG: D-2-hydroxyacid dehydrogenase [Halobacteriales archaeon]